ncbi:hypothetical protein EVAR_101277_1 [Eumeta japonica]|uniref:Uncharacterized protein n=1 Tax=Eumeta variegata TaxID=151549 RepID=A0A4C1SA75_EUMVA|nr:hypothetical protein EVAR_101277_1 [Eumeta japonica]
MGPPDGGRPIPIRKITNWKRVSTALEKIDTPNLNSIPNDIASTDEIDLAIGALTNHVGTLVEEASGRFRHPRIAGSFARYLELIRQKRSFAPRERISHSGYRSRARALQRKVKSHVREFRNGVRATSWRKSNHPTKRFGQLPKRSKPRDIPLYPHSKNLIIQWP